MFCEAALLGTQQKNVPEEQKWTINKDYKDKASYGKNIF